MTFPPSERRRPTIKDVASDSGVSIKTVSRVVHGVASVDARIAQRVSDSIRKLGYRPNQLASTLKSGSATSMIGLVIKDISNEFYASIALGVSSITRGQHSQLITAASDEDIATPREIDLILDLCARRVDGLLIIPRGGDYTRLKSEIEMGVPMVFIDRKPEGLDADSVLLDNAAGTEAAVQELIRLGHRRIGFIFHSLDLFQIQERVAGAEKALRAAGLAFGDSLVVSEVLEPIGARVAAARFLALDEPPTAIFCANNVLTEGAIEAVVHAGASTTIAGFDDFRFSHLVPVPLLLVAYDAREYGRTAARLLFERIAGDRSPQKTVVIPTKLIRRGLLASVPT